MSKTAKLIFNSLSKATTANDSTSFNNILSKSSKIYLNELSQVVDEDGQNIFHLIAVAGNTNFIKPLTDALNSETVLTMLKATDLKDFTPAMLANYLGHDALSYCYIATFMAANKTLKLDQQQNIEEDSHDLFVCEYGPSDGASTITGQSTECNSSILIES